MTRRHARSKCHNNTVYRGVKVSYNERSLRKDDLDQYSTTIGGIVIPQKGDSLPVLSDEALHFPLRFLCR